MRLKGKVIELGENIKCIDTLSANNISHISMRTPQGKKKKSIVLSVILMILGVALVIVGGGESPFFWVAFAAGAICFIAVFLYNVNADMYNKSIKTQIDIEMNSGKHFFLSCDPDKGPQLLEQLEDCINSSCAETEISRITH